MKTNSIEKLMQRSRKIRESYHELELKYHESEWSVEEDALAFLTDAGLVGRLTMSQQGRWPKENGTDSELQLKIGECFWWLAVLADRMNISIEDAVEQFLSKTEKLLEK
jgi:hypothetical protein